MVYAIQTILVFELKINKKIKDYFDMYITCIFVYRPLSASIFTHSVENESVSLTRGLKMPFGLLNS